MHSIAGRRFRHQLPVHSPLDWRALISGLRAVVAGDDAHRRDVVARLLTAYESSGVLLTDSGTSALALTLSGAAAVALPAYSCYDLATAADAAGCDVVLYDVDPHTLGPDFDSLRRTIRDGAQIVVVAPLYGFPIDMTLVAEIASETGATVVEDAAQGSGATLLGKPVGCFGSVSILSFGRGKGVTGGGGGALLAHDAQGDGVLRRARGAVGRGTSGAARLASLAAQWVFGRPALYGLPAALPFLRLGATVYRPPQPPRDASAAAVGVLARTLTLVSRETQARRANGARLAAAACERRSVRSPAAVAGAEPGYLRLPVLCSDVKWRDIGSGRRLGIMPAYPTALSDLKGFAERVGNRSDAFAGARLLARRLATLPTHSFVSESELETMERWLSDS